VGLRFVFLRSCDLWLFYLLCKIGRLGAVMFTGAKMNRENSDIKKGKRNQPESHYWENIGAELMIQVSRINI